MTPHNRLQHVRLAYDFSPEQRERIDSLLRPLGFGTYVGYCTVRKQSYLYAFDMNDPLLDDTRGT